MRSYNGPARPCGLKPPDGWAPATCVSHSHCLQQELARKCESREKFLVRQTVTPCRSNRSEGSGFEDQLPVREGRLADRPTGCKRQHPQDLHTSPS